jgi:hypothetical protein
MYDTDHIDPTWKEGRDYQLVCGRDCIANFIERDTSLNQKKSNCFLPWRVAADEIGAVPVEQGDLCMFLVGASIEQDIPGEWVLMEFLSQEWFVASVGTCSRSHRRVNVESMQEGLSIWREEHKLQVQEQLNKCQAGSEIYRQNNPNHFDKVQEEQRKWREKNPDKVIENIRKAVAVKYMCTVTGKISRPGALTNYQRKRGIDTSNRVRL